MNKLIMFCIFLGGLVFGWSLDLQLSVPEKFTIAFPTNSDVKIALDDLESLALSSALSPKEYRKRYEEKLTFWTYTCTKNNPISRFDSVKKVKKLSVNEYCLELRDNDLSRYIGMTQVGIRLSQPSLKPQIEIGQKIAVNQPLDWMTATAAFSMGSGVAVLTSDRGASNGTSSFISYDIRTGKKIVNLEVIPGADIRNISLSPNGRVVAVPAHKRHAGNEVLFLDTETGNILGRIEDTVGVQVWLPEISSALLKHSGNSTILLADFLTGKVSPYEVNSKVQQWGVTVTSSPSRLLVGTGNAFYLVKNERTTYGVKPTIVKDFYPKQNLYSAYDPPIVMLDGKVAVFTLGNFLVQYNLDTGKEARIETYPFLDKKFEKLNEETLLAKLSNSDELKVFNIKDISISTINEDISQRGTISALNGRNGYMHREFNQIWISDKLRVGQSKTLVMLVAEREAEEQVKRMVEIAKEEREIALFGMPIEDEPRLEVPMQIRRDANGNMIQDSYGRQVLKDSASKIQAFKSKFLAMEIPTNTKYEFIGVKKSANTTTKEILVTIKKTDRPILLFLSSCATVNWKIIKQPGSRLVGIFQQIRPVLPMSKINIDNTDYSTLTMTRFNYCTFEKNSTEYKSLEQEILGKDGKSIEKFQNAESGVAFSVGN
jgi:hypothetical protein